MDRLASGLVRLNVRDSCRHADKSAGLNDPKPSRAPFSFFLFPFYSCLDYSFGCVDRPEAAWGTRGGLGLAGTAGATFSFKASLTTWRM